MQSSRARRLKYLRTNPLQKKFIYLFKDPHFLYPVEKPPSPHLVMTISDLSAEANNYVFSPQVSFRNWLHVSRTLLYEAKAHVLEDDLERAYVLYLRYADLVLNKLEKHPDCAANRLAYLRALRLVPQVLEESERLKAKLQMKYTAFSLASPELAPLSRVSSMSPEFKPDFKQYLDESAVASPTKSEPPRLNVDRSFADTLSSLKRTTQPSAHSAQGDSTVGTQRAKFSYPSPIIGRYTNPALQPPGNFMLSPTTKPNHEFPLPSESPSRVDGLRTLHFPRGLQSRFLAAALSNTKNDLETCGILCGRLERQAFVVTDLVVPFQESTSNTCTTLREELLFEYADSRNLFILGWIHTHPTQTCFMSSVDLHTHSSYQIMLPEAIAAVCAPSHGFDFAIYRLTDPPGMKTITSCHQQSFHPHDEADLYCRAQPGHVQISEYAFEFCDLRLSKA